MLVRVTHSRQLTVKSKLVSNSSWAWNICLEDVSLREIKQKNAIKENSAEYLTQTAASVQPFAVTDTPKWLALSEQQLLICLPLTVHLRGGQSCRLWHGLKWRLQDPQTNPVLCAVTLELTGNIFFLLSRAKWEAEPENRTCDSHWVRAEPWSHFLLLN